MKNILLILFLLLTSIVFSYTADFNEEYYYNQIINATFIGEKNKIALKLASFKTQKAKDLLLKLFDDDSSWNRAGVIDALFSFEDYEINKIIVDRFFSNDIMIEDDLSRGIKKYFKGFYKLLEDKYSHLEKTNDIDKILKLYGESKTAEGESFLKKIILDANSKNRQQAFKYLSLNYKENNYSFAKQFINDIEVKEYALGFILESGTKDDLPLFIKIILSKEDYKYLVLSYNAINKWGDDDLKSKFYLKALMDNDENIIQSVLYIFNNLKSDEIKNELIRLTRQSKYQDIRITACENLLKYNNKNIIPYAISVLKETYSSNESFNGADIFISFLTFGISALSEKYNKKRTKENFEARITDIEKSLSSIAGIDNLHGYNQWLDWAVYNGYTVDGINIIQYLFSGYSYKTKKAVQYSLFLLGFNTERDFYIAHPEFLNYKTGDFLIGLAKLLIDKGYLTEEKY